MDDYILVDKLHRQFNPFVTNYETFNQWSKRLKEDHGLEYVAISDFVIPTRFALFKVVDKIKALKFFFDNSQFTKKPETKFRL